ncbi:DUF982 domain-containing protein [Rhizobium subbaraonis]|uniref:DUF982 domain-containing protein n=1 Tax=Rhizobium subbaraonis TaxID=908946 RepID=UPI000BE326D6|nr:DUF982 domain-containing protein [Rhizobium subbaraonis]
MDPKRWNKAVEVETERLGRIRDITSTEEAARFLLERWPVEPGPAHLKARIACLSVLEGKRQPDHAREAFVAAAEEAGILVRA